jgi:hypothetical protein
MFPFFRMDRNLWAEEYNAVWNNVEQMTSGYNARFPTDSE